jgi:hypothetical protein
MATETVDAASAEALMEACLERGWSDGLPVIPPIRHLVDAHVAASGLPAENVIGEIPPAWGRATVERIAANTVMAGCRPEYVPAVIVALRALLEPKVGLHGFQCTTHVAAPLLIFNGPMARELGIESGHNCLGQGFRANATIGRAVRLILTNLGGAQPGGMDKATFGQPGKFTYCLAENEAESPFPPYHVEAGFAAEQSAVTVFAAEAPHNINNHASNDPWSLLLTVADSMRTLGNNNMYLASECILVLGVEHARIIAAAGWGRRHVQFFLYEHARRPVKDLAIGGMHGADLDRNLWGRWVDRRNADEMVPVARVPEDIKIFVAGGAGRHSLFIPGWGTRSCTLPFEFPSRG